MKNPFLYLALLLLWIPLGAYWYNNNHCCTATAASTLSSSTPLSISDGPLSIATNPQNLRFALAGATPIIPDPVEAEFGKVVDYLKANPGKTFLLTGLYQSEEQNTTSYDNLGMGRAEAVKAYFVGRGIAANRIRTDSALKENLSVDQQQVIGAMNYSFGNRGISIADGSLFSAAENDHFLFGQNAYTHLEPVSDKLNSVLQKTADYLKANPTRSMKITGIYGEKEENKSILPNLGLARANDIKKMLEGMGVAANQITMDARMEKEILFEDGKLYGGVDFDFMATPEKVADLDAIYNRLKAKPIVLYFATNAENLELTAQQRQDFSDIIYYLDRKPQAQIEANGHTDDRGDYALNQRLSRKRAEFVRDYIAKNGINVAKITAIGFGPDQPIADNETPDGRSKNRRVEIQLK